MLVTLSPIPKLCIQGRVELVDQIHAARVLVKVAEGSGGIASLQRYERDLVKAIANFPTEDRNAQHHIVQFNVLMVNFPPCTVSNAVPCCDCVCVLLGVVTA